MEGRSEANHPACALNLLSLLRSAFYTCKAPFLHATQVHSVKSLQREHGPFNAVIVAAGAAVGALADAPLQGLPLQLCQVQF